jgi:ligand-binding SRPBCC domain-containing protein
MTSDAVHFTSAASGRIQIGRAPHGPGYRLEASQLLPCPRERIFEFFSDAYQLQALTPPWLRFSVLTPAPIAMAHGTRIDYRLRIHGVPMRWQSLISHWEPPLRFVDVQTRGPYRHWRHEHVFEVVDDGTLCRDVVDYSVYGGAIIHGLFVRRDLRRIFAFRQQKLLELFAGSAGAGSRSTAEC